MKHALAALLTCRAPRQGGVGSFITLEKPFRHWMRTQNAVPHLRMGAAVVAGRRSDLMAALSLLASAPLGVGPARFILDRTCIGACHAVCQFPWLGARAWHSWSER